MLIRPVCLYHYPTLKTDYAALAAAPATVQYLDNVEINIVNIISTLLFPQHHVEQFVFIIIEREGVAFSTVCVCCPDANLIERSFDKE